MSSFLFSRATLTSRRLLSQTVRYTSTATSQAPVGRTLSEGEQMIADKLTEKFSPSRLQVEDISGGCGTFFAISISSPAFKGLTTLKQHRLVTSELKKEISTIHGLQLNTIPE